MSRLQNILSSLLLSLAAVSAVSCGGDNGEDPVKKADAPQLVSTDPADGATGLAGTTLSVKFTFDQNIKCPSSQHSLITAGDAVVDKVLAYNKDLTVSLSGLTEGSSYTLSIPAGAVSGYQDNPAAAITFRFSMKEAEKDSGRNPDKALTNAKASQQAVKLYDFLIANYGSKTISGAMGGTAWETSYTDYISQQAGKYPGIVGFDYLFMNWPAKYWSGCPDYDDITPVKGAWDAGSIVQICWHWTVPSKEGETDINNYSYNTRAFGVENALKEGTWQNKLINSQIEKLAGHISLLRDAGIPVLFRPLHEAAGDYTWGAWFWWGYDGPEACKKLWKYLYDKLTNVYGLDNLIWVWTVQTSDAGKLADVSKLREWYPGDECVDIVGADLYVAKGTSQSDVFKLVNNSVSGRKIVVLSEFGNLLDMDKAFSEDAPWGYFMNWSNFVDGQPVLWCKNQDGSYTWNNTASDWSAAMSGKLTLNRGDLGGAR